MVHLRKYDLKLLMANQAKVPRKKLKEIENPDGGLMVNI